MSETSGEKLQCGRSVTYQTGNRPLQMPLFAAAHTQSPNKLTAEKNEVTKIDDRYLTNSGIQKLNFYLLTSSLACCVSAKISSKIIHIAKLPQNTA